MDSLVLWLLENGFAVQLTGISAADRYMGKSGQNVLTIRTNAHLGDLAAGLDGLKFPGIEGVDALIEEVPAADETLSSVIRQPVLKFISIYDDTDAPTVEPDEPAPIPGSYTADNPLCVDPKDILALSWDARTRRYIYGEHTYALMRSITKGKDEGRAVLNIRRPRSFQEAAFTAEALARFPFKTVGFTASDIETEFEGEPLLTETEQRAILTQIVTGKWTARGLDYLSGCGFLSRHWPELAELSSAEHAKEFHPEGNGWKHTLEALRCRKTTDFLTSLGILLHDVGKPESQAAGRLRYNGHAETGAAIARRFLRRLEFAEDVIEGIAFLVRNHMMPAAFPRLPLSVTRPVMDSPLAPSLLELYRCDESSSFKSPEAYYDACRVYKSYVKHRRLTPGC